MMLLLVLLLYALPFAALAGLLWLLWKLADRHLPRWAAQGIVAASLTAIVVSEIVPARIADRIARRSAHDVAGSVVVDSIVFGSASLASEAVAEQPGLRFAEGVNSRSEGSQFARLPPGRFRFAGVRARPDGGSCAPGEVEEWVAGGSAGAPPLRRCVGWSRVAAFQARYTPFHNRFISYRVGPWRVTERQEGVVRRSDGRAFNVEKHVEVSGGLWWHFVDIGMRLTGLDGFGHRGHMAATFDFLPPRTIVDFRYRGAGVQASGTAQARQAIGAVPLERPSR